MRAAKFSIKINTGKGLRKCSLRGDFNKKKVYIMTLSKGFKPHFFKNRNVKKLKARVAQ